MCYTPLLHFYVSFSKYAQNILIAFIGVSLLVLSLFILVE